MKNLLVLLASLAMLLPACKKDNDPPPPAYPDYFGLTVGNYRVYQHFNDLNGTLAATNIMDSVRVEKDTAIGGATYFKMVQYRTGSMPAAAVSFLRDSLQFVVDLYGQVLFSSENIGDTLRTGYLITGGAPNGSDTLANWIMRMSDPAFVTNVPAGTFSTVNRERIYTLWFTGTFEQREEYARFAENIGLVEERWPYFSSPTNGVVRQLVRYGNN